MQGYLEAFDAIAPQVLAGRTVRTLLCPACGAPALVAPAAASFACGRCNASTPLSPRPELESIAAAARGAGTPRTTVTPEHDLARTPQGLEKLAFPGFRELGAVDKLHAAYVDSRKRLGADATQSYRLAAGGGERAEAERCLLWIARLAASVLPSERVHAARPLAEQACELCRDPVNQALACCLLARIAQRSGDADAAREWLAGAPEAAEELALESARRECLVFLAAEASPDVLGIVGTEGTLPPAPAQRLSLGLARVACYERLDEPASALDALAPLLEAYELDIADALRREPRFGPVRATIERAVEEQRKRVKPRVWFYGIGFVVAVLSGMAASWFGRVVDVTCTRAQAGSAKTCQIQESIWGSEISSTTLSDVRDSTRRLYQSDKNERTYVLVLTTELGETVEVSPMGDSKEDVDSQVATLNAFVHDESAKKATIKITNDGPLLVGAVAFAAALVLPVVGLLAFVSARRPRGAAARVLSALD